MLVFVPFAEKGASQISDPMEVYLLKKLLRKVMRPLKVTLLKKWKKPLKKSLQKNAAGGANFALADSETERIKFVLNLFCFVLQGETFCLNLKSANKKEQFSNSPAIKQNISPCYTMHTNTISSMCSKSLQIEGINVQRQLLIELRISFHRY